MRENVDEKYLVVDNWAISLHAKNLDHFGKRTNSSQQVITPAPARPLISEFSIYLRPMVKCSPACLPPNQKHC
jgi:hypothetical protein